MAGVSSSDADEENDHKDDDFHVSGVLRDGNYKNWIKAAEGLVYLQKGLAPFVDREIYSKHAQFISKLPHNVQGTSVICCTLENVLPIHGNSFCYIPRCLCKKNRKSRRSCPKKLCDTFCQLILDEHKTGDPLWRNSDMNAWLTDHWSIAKCYMTTPNHSNSAQTTDASGLLSVVINGIFFQRKVASQLGQPGDVFLQARDMRNAIFHRAKIELTDTELQDILDTFIAVLKDQACLLRDRDASLAVEQLESLKQSDVFVSPEEELQILKKEVINTLKLIEEQQQKVETKKNAAIPELENAAGKVKNDIMNELNERLKQTDVLTKYLEKKMKTVFEDVNRIDSKQTQMEENVSLLREDVVKIYAKLKDRGESTNVKCITYGKVSANAEDKEIKEEAESLLYETGREYITKSVGSKTSVAELINKFESFANDIEKVGTKLTGIKKSSVVFEFECPSLDTLIDLLDYFGSSHCQARLGDIAMALEHVFRKNIHLSASIVPESLQNVITKLRQMENEKTVQFEMECSGVDGLLHVLDVFEGNTAAVSLNGLSKALTDTIKKPVTLHTSIDIDHMKRAIDSLKVHIAEEDAKERERRNQDCCQPSGLDEEAKQLLTERKQSLVVDRPNECFSKQQDDSQVSEEHIRSQEEDGAVSADKWTAYPYKKAFKDADRNIQGGVQDTNQEMVNFKNTRWPIKYSILTMAEPPAEFDFHAVLDTVTEHLLNDMDPVPVLEELRNLRVFQPRILRDIREKYNTTTEKIEALLQLVWNGGYTEYDQLKKCLNASGQEALVYMMEAAEKGKEYKPVEKKKPMTQEEILKEDIIEYYLVNESRMPVVPLVENYDAELTSFYVRPPMIAYNKPNAFGQVKQSTEQHDAESTIYVRLSMMAYEKPNDLGQVQQSTEQAKTKISSYRNLLYSDNGTYKRIYLTADAGMGKTSFSKMLARTWCQAHKPDKVVEEKFNNNDLDTMKSFDFLFLIKLREYQGKNMCCLDDMIVAMLQSKLPRSSSYTKPFVEQVLCSRQCLIIVDGFDEWSHPVHTQSQALPLEVIPHPTRLPGCCSVLTTTRPWKLSDARLSGKDIDRQVEISELDETSARELESRAIEILIENQRKNGQVAANTKTKTVGNFENSVPKQILGHILYIPFVLLQMICLWFENSPIGKSLCEVYSNISELTLTRWLVKTDSGHSVCKCEPSKEHENITLKCMQNNKHCQSYLRLLLKIGELAFSTLFNDIREKSLLFDRIQVLKCLGEEELEQCLKMGLLSQVMDTTSLTKVHLQLYFPHKTLHEFFCALFLATYWNNAKPREMSIKQTISKRCKSVSDIVEMSEVFVFVCGLNPEVYSDITRHLATIVSTDQRVIDYRNSVEKDSDLLEDYQDMQISCFLESTRNQHPECRIVIEDMFVGNSYFEKKQPLLTSAAHTLKYLTLYKVSLTDGMCSAISTLNNLQGLYLDNVGVSSDSLNAVSDCISGCVSLQKLRLRFHYQSSDTNVKHREASYNCLLRSIEAKTLLTYLSLHGHHNGQSYVLDLSKHNKLQKLEDLWFPPKELHINTEQLVTFAVCEYSAPVVSSLLRELHGAPVLETLKLQSITHPPFRIDITALPRLTELTLDDCDLRDSTVTLTLPLLTKFILYRGDLRDSTVTLSPEMTSLETITLHRTMVNIPGCRELFLSISKLPQPIAVKLEEIYMKVEVWRELFLSISKVPQSTVTMINIFMDVKKWRELFFDVLGKLPKSIHVEMRECRGAYTEEWRTIFKDIKESSAFCVICTDLNSPGAGITFDTVVV